MPYDVIYSQSCKYSPLKFLLLIFFFTKERVVPIKGATEFLLACGFEDKVLPVEGKWKH